MTIQGLFSDLRFWISVTLRIVPPLGCSLRPILWAESKSCGRRRHSASISLVPSGLVGRALWARSALSVKLHHRTPPGPFWPQNSALLFQPTSVSHLGAMRVFCVPCCAVWDFSPGWGWGQYGLCHVWVCHLPHSLAAASSPALGAGTEAQCSGASTLTWGLLGFSPFPWAWFKMGGGRGLRAFSLAWVGRG